MTMRNLSARVIYPSALVFCILLLSIPPLAAQREVEFSGNIPTAPTGLANQPLPEGPFYYPTAEGMDIRVVVHARGIEFPTSIAFLPGDRILVSTRHGLLRLIENGQLHPEPVSGGPASFFQGESGAPGAVHGYIDLALHPQFADNGYVYLSYTQPRGGNSRGLAIGRGVWDADARVLRNFTNVWESDAGVGGVGRITFDDNNMLYATAGGGDPQDINSQGGKVLRMHDDGSIPADNPFVGQSDRPEVYSLGHRGSLGLAIHPQTGDVWQNENGPQGGDELNHIRPGLNYGWPLVSLGSTYPGPWQADQRPTHEGFEPPVVYWTPSIAVSGLLFYTGDALPAWTGDVFVGALRMGQVPGTGHLQRILFNMDMQELRRESLLVDLRQRIRDVRQGPDGLIYVVTDEQDGAILRIEPAN